MIATLRQNSGHINITLCLQRCLILKATVFFHKRTRTSVWQMGEVTWALCEPQCLCSGAANSWQWPLAGTLNSQVYKIGDDEWITQALKLALKQQHWLAKFSEWKKTTTISWAVSSLLFETWWRDLSKSWSLVILRIYICWKSHGGWGTGERKKMFIIITVMGIYGYSKIYLITRQFWSFLTHLV